jgi:hypothetical protein
VTRQQPPLMRIKHVEPLCIVEQVMRHKGLSGTVRETALASAERGADLGFDSGTGPTY